MKVYDFKKEWPKIQKQLEKFSKDARVALKKGEKELVRLSKEGKMRMDASSLSLKKEHLFYLIGKQFVSAKNIEVSDPKLSKLLKELKEIDAKLKVINRKIKKSKKK